MIEAILIFLIVVCVLNIGCIYIRPYIDVE